MNDLVTKSIKHNIWVKIGITIVISFLLMIPVSHIEEIISERNEYGQVVKKEVAEKWSKSQVAGAIVLSIPAIQRLKEKDKNGKVTYTENKKILHFLPKELEIKADTKSVIRYRGVYKVPLYETKLLMAGSFSDVSEKTLELKDTTVNWEDAVLSLGVKDIRGLKAVEMKWNDIKISEDVGAMPSKLLDTSINAKVVQNDELKSKGSGKFSIDVTLRGSEALEFYPFGQTTTVNMISNWGSPSFNGAFLPEDHKIENKNFVADWKILGLTRSLPKHWEGYLTFSTAIQDSKFGVDLHLPLQSYQLNTRSVKYSLLFIILTFVTFFFVEIIYKIRFHPMHYGMTGAILILFYLLLLSFSEHIGFSWAYCLAGITTISTISMFVLGVTKVKKSALIIFTQLSILYGFLFVLLQQEDYTLVFGATGLWVILAVIMFVTRKIDWFSLSLGENKKEVF